MKITVIIGIRIKIITKHNHDHLWACLLLNLATLIITTQRYLFHVCEFSNHHTMIYDFVYSINEKQSKELVHGAYIPSYIQIYICANRIFTKKNVEGYC